MKKLIILSLVLSIIAIGGFLTFLMTFDVNQYKDDIISAVEKQTKRTFNIEGELALGISLIPTIQVSGVSLGNAGWGSQANMLDVGTFEAQIAILPLLNRTVVLKRLILNDATILLEKNDKGEANWVFGEPGTEASAEPQAESTGPALALSDENIIEEISINNVRLTYIDATSGKTEKLVITNLNVQADDLDSPLTIDLKATYNDLELALTAETGSLQTGMSNKPFMFDINAAAGAIKLVADGNIKQPKDATGIEASVDIQIDNISDLNTFLEQELPDFGPIKLTADIADDDGSILVNSIVANLGKARLEASGRIQDLKNTTGINLSFSFNMESLSDLNALLQSELPELGPLSVGGNISDKDGGYAVSDLELVMAGTDLSGHLTASISGERPALTATLTSTQIDLTPFTSKETDRPEETGKTPKKDKLFSPDPLPLEMLKSANANLSLTAGTIKTTSYDLQDTEITLQLNDGNLTLSRLAAGILGGKLTGSLDLAVKGRQATIDTRLDLSNIQLSRLPALSEKISGATTTVSVNTRGSGESVAAIMAGLNGQVKVTTEEGKISSAAMKTVSAGADVLLSLLKTGKKQEGSILECAVINFTIRDGMAVADNGIAMVTSELNVLGGGSVNLKTEELDIGITPKVRQGVSIGDLAELVRLGGTLVNPTLKTDTMAALNAGISAVATGAFSLFGSTARSDSDVNSCDIALGGKSGIRSAAGKPAPGKPDPVARPATNVKDAAGEIGDKLKGLFN